MCIGRWTQYTNLVHKYFSYHLAGKAGTKHPTKVLIGSSSTHATKISSERSMEPRLEGPWNIPSDIGCVLGIELAVFRGSYPAVSKMEEATPPKHIARTSPAIARNCPR